MIGVLIFISLYGLLLILVELLQQKVFTKVIWARRVAHIFSGFITFFFPDYLNIKQIYFLSVFFFVTLVFTRSKKSGQGR